MATFFQGNPFTTHVGQLIEKATDGTQASENWAMIMEVCDQINDTDEGPKDAVRAIRKRLNTSIGKNNTAVMYSLTMLETAVKNCGKRFHIQIANKEFLHDLIKIIGPKNDPPQIVQEKILSLIQSWADAFRNQPELKEVEKMYIDLKSKGIEFPMTDLDNFAPIHTPGMTAAPISKSPPSKAAFQAQRPAGQAAGVIEPTKEQLVKLRRDLDIVQGNTKVFGEMLDDLIPGQSDLSDLELLNELNRTCRQMQPRIVELLNQVGNEEVTSELLKVNDDLNNMFIRYDRFDSYHREPRPPPVNPMSGPIPSHPPPAYTPRADDGKWADDIDIKNLIDLSAETPSITGGLQLLDLENSVNQSQDEFDMFAQSRQSFDQNKRTESSAAAATYNEQHQPQYTGSIGSAVTAKSQNYGNNLLDEEREVDEMESWLEAQPTSEHSQPVTSLEFDNFLAERANSTEERPDRTTTSPSRRLKTEETESAMFAL